MFGLWRLQNPHMGFCSRRSAEEKHSALPPRYFIHTAEFFTVYLRRGTCDLRLEKQPGSLPLRCRRRRRRRREESIASAKRRARVLPRDAYVLSDSQPNRDVLCGSANWACPQWGCGASCCAQCLHSAERSVFSGGAVRAARSAYAGTLDVCCARSRSAEEKRVGGKDGHFHCGCLLRRLEVPSCRHR